MKNILKPIFEYITGNYIIFENPIYNYVIMGCVGVIAFGIAWFIVGELYAESLISGSEIGSIIHWGLRFIAFLIIYVIFLIAIWFIKMLIIIPIWVWILLVATVVVIATIRKILEK